MSLYEESANLSYESKRMYSRNWKYMLNSLKQTQDLLRISIMVICDRYLHCEQKA